jgi:hypothetical protein
MNIKEVFLKIALCAGLGMWARSIVMGMSLLKSPYILVH